MLGYVIAEMHRQAGKQLLKCTLTIHIVIISLEADLPETWEVLCRCGPS